MGRKLKDINGFAPGSFGFHEMLDRTCMLAEVFAEHVSNHPSAEYLADDIEEVEKSLFDLYRKMADLHM